MTRNFFVLFQLRDSSFSSVTESAQRKTAVQSSKMHDAILFRRLAHNYGSVVEVIAPGGHATAEKSSGEVGGCSDSMTFESQLQQRQLLKQGYLLKRSSSNSRIWHRLFFVLTPKVNLRCVCVCVCV